MKRLKPIVIITCVSFTVELLLYVAIALLVFKAELTGLAVYALFAMSLGIALLLSVVDWLGEHVELSLFVDNLLRIAVCYVVVLGIGFAVGMFAFSWMALVYVSPILLPVYVVTYLVSYFTIKEYTNSINAALVHRRSAAQTEDSVENK